MPLAAAAASTLRKYAAGSEVVSVARLLPDRSGFPPRFCPARHSVCSLSLSAMAGTGQLGLAGS